jgi:hypothetical protein
VFGWGREFTIRYIDRNDCAGYSNSDPVILLGRTGVKDVITSPPPTKGSIFFFFFFKKRFLTLLIYSVSSV